ncbi:MAG: DUF6850 family outer membrane beta-barrel protein [Marinifilaceae bacterium]
MFNKLFKNKYIYTIIIVLVLTMRVSSQQFVGNSLFFKKEVTNFFVLNWNNPASMYYYPSSSFTDVYLGLVQRIDNDLYLVQEGNCLSSRFFKAKSYVKNSKDVYYGAALYDFSTKENVNWNTASDYNLFAPYVMADTVGGESKKETYMFKGGYATKAGRFLLGIDGFYKASLEYRNVDPRPQNTTSDFRLSGGFLFSIRQNQNIGFKLAFRQYKQSNKVKSYRKDSFYKMFYMRGFGVSEKKFSSVCKSESNYYDLKEYRLQFDYKPINGNGVYLLSEYRNSYFDFVYGNTLGTISDMTSNCVKVEFGYSKGKNNKTSCLKIHAQLNERKGMEYNYAENMALLNKVNKYNQKWFVGGFAFLKNVNRERVSTLLVLAADYKIDNSEYTLPQAEQNISKLIPSISYGLRIPFKESVLSSKMKVAYSASMNKYVDTSNLNNAVGNTMFRSNYDYMSASFVQFGVESRYDYRLSDKANVFLGISMEMKKFERVNYSGSFCIESGIAF